MPVLPSFANTAEAGASDFPFTRSRRLPRSGAYLGTRYDGGPLFFDPSRLQQEGDMTPGGGTLTGLMGAGKSGLLKSIAYGLMSQTLRTADGEQIKKLRTSSAKHLHGFGICEMAPVMGLLRGYNFELGKSCKVNPIDAQVVKKLPDLIEVLATCADEATDGPLINGDMLALEIVARMILPWEDRRLESASATLLHLTQGDVQAFIDRTQAEMWRVLPNDIAVDWAKDKSRKVNISVEEVLKGAQRMGQALWNVCSEGGSFGAAFGGNSSLYRMLTVHAANFDMSYLNARASSLWSRLQELYLLFAARDGHDEMVPSVRINDEMGQNNSPQVLIVHARQLVVQRRFPTVDLRASQFLNQMTHVSNDVQIQSAAETISNAQTFRFIGQMNPHDEEGFAELGKLGMSPVHQGMIAEYSRNKERRFCLWLNGQRVPIFFTPKVSNMLAPAVYTDQARDFELGIDRSDFNRRIEKMIANLSILN
jgi:hypothetical protein